MANVIAVANQKGGVAKTTTAAALAAGLVRRGYKVLAVDLDAQGNLSESVKVMTDDLETIYEVMKGEADVRKAIQKCKAFDIIPADLSLAGADLEFTHTGREYKLKKALLPILKNYDYIILDTPPALGIMTVNAFVCSDEIIITANGVDGVKSIGKLYDTIQSVIEYCNSELQVAGVLFTRHIPRAIINQETISAAKDLGKHLNFKVFNTYVRTSVMVDEARAKGVDIFTYDETNNVSVDYNAFIDEFLKGKIE